MKTGVEMQIPLFSPMVTKINVLHRAEEMQTKGDIHTLRFRSDPFKVNVDKDGKEIHESANYALIDELASLHRQRQKMRK